MPGTITQLWRPALGAALLGFVALVLWTAAPGLTQAGRLALLILSVAIVGWTLTPLNDTLVALAAALAMVVAGVTNIKEVHQSLGSELIWLLIAAFVLAAVLRASGVLDHLVRTLLRTFRSVGALFYALAGARLHPRYAVVGRYLELDGLIEQADLVITAEGSLDGQSPYGKIPCEVGRRARERGVPVIALAGTIGAGVHATFDHGIDAFASIIRQPCTLDQAIADARSLLMQAAESAMRMIKVGTRLGVPEGFPPPHVAHQLIGTRRQPREARV